MDNKKKKIITTVILVICIVVFLVSAIFVAKYLVDRHNNQKGYENLTSTTQPTQTPGEVPKPDYSEALKKNPDTVGWIKIPDTNIDFPVVQATDNEYYLSRNFERKSDYRGAIYMDMYNDPTNLQANTIIYGHNAYDGTVFSDIDKYQDIEFYKEHPIVEFNTLDSYHKWKICAVFITNQAPSEDNNYIFDFIYPFMEGDVFNWYKGELDKRTLYYTGVDFKDGDKFLTLSSCTRKLDMGSYRAKSSIVVVARMLRDGEAETVDVSKAYVNENPKYPQLYYKKYGLTNPYKDDEKWYPRKNDPKWPLYYDEWVTKVYGE